MPGQPPPPPRHRGVAERVMKALEKVAPRHAKAARTESEQWFICCPECGNSKCVAELGGIR